MLSGRLPAAIAVVALLGWASPCQAEAPGRLELRFVDEDGTTVIPVRVEIRDAKGKSYTAPDGLPVPSSSEADLRSIKDSNRVGK